MTTPSAMMLWEHIQSVGEPCTCGFEERLAEVEARAVEPWKSAIRLMLVTHHLNEADIETCQVCRSARALLTDTEDALP